MLEYLNLVVFDSYRLETYSLSGDDNETTFQSYLVYSMMVSVDIQPLSDDPDTIQGCAILLSNTDDITGISSFILPRSVVFCVLNVDNIVFPSCMYVLHYKNILHTIMGIL